MNESSNTEDDDETDDENGLGDLFVPKKPDDKNGQK